MLRFAMWLVIFVALLGIAGMVWLLAPLPTNQYDWQAQVLHHEAEGECATAAAILIDVHFFTHDDWALERLQRYTNDEICPYDGIDQSSFELIASEPIPSVYDPQGFAGSVRDAFSLWWAMSDARETWMHGLADMRYAFRCDRVFRNARELEWARQRNAYWSEASPPHVVPQWESRYAECRAIANRELAGLEDATVERASGLRAVYRRMLNTDFPG